MTIKVTLLLNWVDKFLSMCHYEKDINEFSLALLEKAYVKVYGGL